MHDRTLVDEAGLAVARQQERPVEIDELRARRQQHGRRHGERGADHAADENPKAEPPGFRRQRQRLGQSAGLVELDVDRVVAVAERFEVFRDMRAGLKDVDIVMMLRLQRERMNGAFVPSVREYFRFFGLDADKLKLAKHDALVMHPGPMNRGVEIDSSIADGPQSLIREQVEMGVAVRMAVLEALAQHLPNG